MMTKERITLLGTLLTGKILAKLEKKDLERIEKFLKQNPVYNFSSLAREALLHYIENPPSAKPVKKRG